MLYFSSSFSLRYLRLLCMYISGLEKSEEIVSFFFPPFYFYQLEANYNNVVGFAIHESDMDIHVFPIPIPLPHPSPSHPSGSSQCTCPENLSHASNLGWWSVSPLIVYMFQCCSLKTSQPRHLPKSPKVCSVHLCLFFFFSYRVIITSFLNSIYMC